MVEMIFQNISTLGRNHMRIVPRPQNATKTNANLYNEINKRGKKKKKRVAKVEITNADTRAASLVLAGQLLKQARLPKQILINQKSGDYLGSQFLTQIIIPALELAGVQARMISRRDVQPAGDCNTGILMLAIAWSPSDSV